MQLQLSQQFVKKTGLKLFKSLYQELEFSPLLFPDLHLFGYGIREEKGRGEEAAEANATGSQSLVSWTHCHRCGEEFSVRSDSPHALQDPISGSPLTLMRLHSSTLSGSWEGGRRMLMSLLSENGAGISLPSLQEHPTPHPLSPHCPSCQLYWLCAIKNNIHACCLLPSWPQSPYSLTPASWNHLLQS